MVMFRNSPVVMKMDSGYLNKMGIYWKERVPRRRNWHDEAKEVRKRRAE